MKTRIYYGWWIVVVASAAMVGTLPGRTQGLGLITEPLLADLQIDRVSYAQLNLWATIIGATFAIGIGRVLDRDGARIVLTGVAAALGLVVCAMSRARSFNELVLWITLTRGFGQSALSVVSIAMVGHWFVRRVDAAMAGYSVALSVGFMIAFPLVGWMVQAHGWRVAWLAVGVALAGGLAPLALIVVRRPPADVDPSPEGIPPKGGSYKHVERDASAAHSDPAASASALDPVASAFRRNVPWREAIATPAFWVFAVGTALYGLVASGIGLFNESILKERGFAANVYYQTLAVTAMTALVGNFFGGVLATRLPLPRLLAASLFILAGGLALLPQVTTLPHVMIWAAAMGIGGGIVMVLFFSVWPHYYGRPELGRIQGTAQALTVLASAVGPLLLALCVEWTGRYDTMFRVLAAIIAAVGAAALFVRAPDRSRG